MKFNLRNILRSMPLLAVITEGYAVGLSIEREMGWNIGVVIAASLLVAGTGFWGVQVWNAFSEFNATLKRSERDECPPLPTWKPTIILGIWFSGVVLLTVFLDVSPVLHTWAPPALVVIGFSSSFLFSLSNLHATREEERVAYRQRKESERQAERNEKKEARKEEKVKAQEIATIRQKISASGQGFATMKRPKSGSKLDDATLLLYWTRDPYMTSQQMAEKLVADRVVAKISRQAVDQRKKKMKSRGLIVENPDGRIVEYIEVGVASTVTGAGGAE